MRGHFEALDFAHLQLDTGIDEVVVDRDWPSDRGSALRRAWPLGSPCKGYGSGIRLHPEAVAHVESEHRDKS